MLYEIFGRKGKKILNDRLMPISQILELDSFKFVNLLKNIDWLYKIFIVFDPTVILIENIE